MRKVVAAAGVLVSSLLVANTAAAAPPRSSCDGRATARRALARLIHRKPERTVQRHVAGWIVRGTRPPSADDDEAIQNDGAAVGLPPEPLAADLQPLGLLASHALTLPRPDQFSRRSPRAPPAFS